MKVSNTVKNKDIVQYVLTNQIPFKEKLKEKAVRCLVTPETYFGKGIGRYVRRNDIISNMRCYRYFGKKKNEMLEKSSKMFNYIIFNNFYFCFFPINLNFK